MGDIVSLLVDEGCLASSIYFSLSLHSAGCKRKLVMLYDHQVRNELPGKY